jgi:hypothetical protein
MKASEHASRDFALALRGAAVLRPFLCCLPTLPAYAAWAMEENEDFF